MAANYLFPVYLFVKTFTNCVFVSLFLLVADMAFSQEPGKKGGKHFLIHADAGLAVNRVTDQTFSSLAATGSNFSLTATVSLQTAKTSHTAGVYYTGGKLVFPDEKKDQVHLRYYIINYSFLKPLQKNNLPKRIKYSAGAGVDLLYSRRAYLTGFINNKQTKDVAASLKAVAELSVDLSSKPGSLCIINRLHLPVVTAAAQPVYGANAWAVPSQGNRSVKDFSENIRILLPPSFLRIKHQLLISKAIAAKQKINSVCTFDYLQIKHNRHVRQVNYYFGLGYEFWF